MGGPRGGLPALGAGLAACLTAAGVWAGASVRPPEDVSSAKPPPEPVSAKALATTAAASDVATEGRFGPVFEWPTIPLHMVLLPDGRVLGFGAHPTLNEGTQHYAVWNPALGTGPASMVELANTTNTNIFCSGVQIIPQSGDVFIVGGTRKVAGQDNYAIDAFNVFRYRENTLVRYRQQAMAYRRWYPTVLETWDGNQLVIGGRDDDDSLATDPPSGATYSTTPEFWTRGEGWRTLSGARSEDAFGSRDAFGNEWGNWWYPRAFLSRSGKFVLTPYHGQPYVIDYERDGYIQPLKIKWPDGFPISFLSFPSVSYAPGKVLLFGQKQEVTMVDLHGAVPVPKLTDPISLVRQWSNATVQADGKVFVNGGSVEYNDLATAHYRSETWDPATGHWTPGARAAKARLYHSIAMLMPDATILTGAGGSPGPQTNPNTEIYYPPYLFKKDGSGDFAPRPVIEDAPSRALSWNEPFHVRVGAGTTVSRVTLARTGAVTHAFNANQQLIEMAFAQHGQRVDLTTPELAVDAPPGFYLLFVFDAEGVPSVARFIRLMDTGTGIPPPPPPPAGKGLVIYDGSSIGYTPEFGPPTVCEDCAANVKAPAFSGPHGRVSLRLGLSGNVSGLTFHGTSVVPVSQYQDFKIAVYPTHDNLRLRVGLGTVVDGAEAIGASFVVKNLVADQWNTVAIPMGQFETATHFNRVYIGTPAAEGAPAFYLDDLTMTPAL